MKRLHALVLSLAVGAAACGRSSPHTDTPSHADIRPTVAVAHAPTLTPNEGVMAAIAGAPPSFAEVARELPLFEAAGLTREKATRFLSRLKDSMGRSDTEALARLVAFPLTVRTSAGVRQVSDRSEFIAAYATLVTPSLRRAVLAQRPERLRGSGGGAVVGNGALRFRCPDRLLTVSARGGFTCDGPNIRVVAISSD